VKTSSTEIADLKTLDNLSEVEEKKNPPLLVRLANVVIDCTKNSQEPSYHAQKFKDKRAL